MADRSIDDKEQKQTHKLNQYHQRMKDQVTRIIKYIPRSIMGVGEVNKVGRKLPWLRGQLRKHRL